MAAAIAVLRFEGEPAFSPVSTPFVRGSLSTPRGLRRAGEALFCTAATSLLRLSGNRSPGSLAGPRVFVVVFRGQTELRNGPAGGTRQRFNRLENLAGNFFPLDDDPKKWTGFHRGRRTSRLF